MTGGRHHSPDNPWYLVAALLISLAVHGVLWEIAESVQVAAASATPRVAPRPPHYTLVKATRPPVKRPEVRRDPQVRERAITQQTEHLPDLFHTAPLTPPRPPPVEAAIMQGPGHDLLRLPRPPLETPLPPTSPPPKILAIPRESLRLAPDAAPPPRMLADVKRIDLAPGLVPSLVSPTGGPGRLGSPDLVGLGPMSLSLPGRSAPYYPPPPEQAPPPPEPPLHVTDPQQQSNPFLPTPPAPGTEASQILDTLIDVSFKVYRDERHDEGYFELTMRANERSDRIAPIPRDLLFLLDASASINNVRLRRFEQGLSMALDSLSPEDRFNLVVFRVNVQTLFPGLSAPTPENIEKARRFAGQFWSRGRTDVYGGLAPYVNQARESTARPYLIYLISDGQSTAGNKLANNEFIRRVVAENKARACIFSFSVGDDDNPFLMEYLAYKSRGVRLHVRELAGADRQLSTYIGNFAEVVVADLACRITGELQDELFPRELPHLFRGYPLTVWGRFPASTNEIGIRITGTGRDGKSAELVLQRKIADATPAGPEVAKSWAAQKIYWLVGEWSVRNDPSIRREIQSLADRYRIIVPY